MNPHRLVNPHHLAVAAALAGVALATAACGGNSSGTAAGSSSSPTMSATASAGMSTTPSATAANSMPADAASAAGPVGPGCADYAKLVPRGAGSVDGMAQDPVAVAASHNPLLTTLVQAVSGKLNPKVNLVDTLNGGQFTVFAPVDSAFAKVPSATVTQLKTDAPLLTKVLTYHVVSGRLSPDQVTGMHATVEGGSVDVAGTPNALTVNGAHVICGGVRTANATVYLIDGVLTPKG
jgi:uncharacterized surface protein with fasciclin (FAS1) repeats